MNRLSRRLKNIKELIINKNKKYESKRRYKRITKL